MLYYLQSRYYDPNTGRFLNADDTDELDNSKDSVLSPNLYAYCDNNPVVRTDADGHFWFLAALAVVISPEALIVAFGVLAIVAIGYTVGSYLHNQRLFRDSYIHYAKSGTSKSGKSNPKAKSKAKVNKKPKIKYPGNNPSKSPGKGWEWRGKGTPKSGKGNWYNPKTGEGLNPDLHHGEPIGPHWDYTSPDKTKWRLFPNGKIEHK